MDRTRVRSSAVVSVGYNDETFELEIEFSNGRIYRYRQVPVAAYRLLLQAPSIGDYVNKVIKPRFESYEV